MKENKVYMYQNYELNVSVNSLDTKELFKLDATIILIKRKTTLRVASKYYNMSKSTLHRYIRNELIFTSYEVYKKAIEQLEENKKNAQHKGGIARCKKDPKWQSRQKDVIKDEVSLHI